MIRTGAEYMESVRDRREVYINGERVKDGTSHPMFRPLVEIRATIYDMQHDLETRGIMTVQQDGVPVAVGNALPFSQAEWWPKRRATDMVMDRIGGGVTCVGDETVGEMWSLLDATEALAAIDPNFAPNIRAHVDFRSRRICAPPHEDDGGAFARCREGPFLCAKTAKAFRPKTSMKWPRLACQGEKAWTSASNTAATRGTARRFSCVTLRCQTW
ncbi:4-hydroxyphenylacetate 3-hydroxylase N-terminal domain-containing protein [Solirhodobacter olei]|uniref:4-hydroxyphenylacetate 3-hydroxylase N-terminal domain-containing protein n=1 Tax=Solirhodobacter olei TaxID=2493082 RepID=UPI000FD7751A|nr:4-hydroxyphenylacetate 3-hydroxylase N-terminal domain-containing protein [Solirhodobacter olei]